MAYLLSVLWTLAFICSVLFIENFHRCFPVSLVLFGICLASWIGGKELLIYFGLVE